MMKEHSFSVEWRYVVPPGNDVRIVIQQRTDGPFRKDKVGGTGHYYAAREEFTHSHGWRHIQGTATGGHASFDLAFAAAEAQWRALVVKPPLREGDRVRWVPQEALRNGQSVYCRDGTITDLRDGRRVMVRFDGLVEDVAIDALTLRQIAGATTKPPRP